MRVFSLVGSVLLSGCAAIGGGADYKYTHIDKNGASCEVIVGSTRSLAGVSITIDDKCQLTADAESASSNRELVKAVGKLIDRVPMVK